MMRKSAALAAVALFVCAGAGSAQVGFGVGAHIGTTGVGGDVGVALTKMFGIHGSLGTIPIDPTLTFSDLEFEIGPPKTLMTIGLDVFPGAGSFHLSGGVLTGAKETSLLGTYTGDVEFNGRTYNGSQLGNVVGVFETSNAAPFVSIGLGRHTGSGLGIFLDAGVAFMGDPKLSLTAPATGLPAAQQAQFQADLEAERVSVEDDLKKVAKLFPMLNIGIRIGM